MPALRRLLAQLAAIAVVVAACSSSSPSSTPPAESPTTVPPTLASSPLGTPATVTGSPTLAPTPRASTGLPSPSALPSSSESPQPEPVTVVRWHAYAGYLNVELANPNSDVGLLRAAFSLAVIAEDDSVITVLGNGGLPGTAATTIYQLPPLGSYGWWDLLPKKAGTIKSVEFSMPTNQWMTWADVNPPSVVVTGPKVRTSFGYSSLTGRVTVSGGEGPFNVRVIAFLEKGDQFVITDGTVACVMPGTDKPFQTDPTRTIKGATLGKVVAYVTTVPGVPGSIDQLDSPPGC